MCDLIHWPNILKKQRQQRSCHWFVYIKNTQQTRTYDFTCSVSEFTSSTGSIHVNSPDSVKKIWCVNTCFPWNHKFFHVMTRASESVPVLTQYESCQTRSKLVTTGRTRVFTYAGGAVPIMNQYDTCQLVQKWFLVCWVVDYSLAEV